MVSAKPKLTKSNTSKTTTSLHKPKNTNLKSKKPVKNQATAKQTLNAPTPSRQRTHFLEQYQSANSVQLSPLELESIQETSFVELGSEVELLGKQIKGVFWKEVCEVSNVEDGSPVVVIVSASALRAIELLRGVRSLTKECRAVKLFSKHMKVEEQVALLKNCVNIASGTPSRIKKLIDIEALGLSRLKLIVIDMHMDVKGYSLLTLPQVRDEFWDLYKNYLHQRLMEGNLKLCLFGRIPNSNALKGKKKKGTDDA